MLFSYVYDTPIGKVCVTADGERVKRLSFGEELIGEERETELIKQTYSELCEYFAGKRRRFGVPFEPDGTEFQKAVWRELVLIPYGETRSYGEIAKAIGNPKAARAVGQACNKNSIVIIIPCHRAVGKNGALTGFAGGLEVKKALLDIEKTLPQP